MVNINFIINSPAYYTKEYGINEEIYSLCKHISENVDISKYTSVLDTIGITPIIAPTHLIEIGMWKESKHINTTYRFAMISLHINYQEYCNADIEEKKLLIIDNLLNSLSVIKKKIGKTFDYDGMKGCILLASNMFLDNTLGDLTLLK